MLFSPRLRGTYFGASLIGRAEPGDELWHRGFESACFPVVNGNDVVLSSRDGSVYAFVR